MTMQQFLTTTVAMMKPVTLGRGVRWGFAGLVAVWIASTTAATPAAADLIEVNNPSDEVGAPGTTLREALAEAEASPEDDMIVFADHVSEIHLTQGELWIGFFFQPPDSGALMIDGHINEGEDRVRIDAGGKSGVLVAGSGSVCLTGLELVNGKASLGAGLMVWDPANVVIEDSLIAGNYAMSGGGGIYSIGVLTIRDTVVAFNGSGDAGGGLFSKGGYGGFTEATNTMFLDNDARSAGGGILNADAIVTLINPTVSDNTARNGGGIYNHESDLSLSGGDFTGNLADRKGNDVYYTAGSSIDPADLAGLDVYEEQPKSKGGGRR